ncbi:ATP-dependent Clp protease proteolytic subunit precursor [Candidatus Hodgkinia cicadicola]|uniref:ATP-dependent Clp protease proteolytic subunit n=1 Tax=Candidatus Hodgkinia cicadicola TaxID=573658 RepID=A0ABX4MGE3_9HYPH|nr:ATP-dependent Clp protease proteolytic subunit precursor [Candidatus Hodgkinia cicadicola]PIM95478.1 ATP-dependent Clp protease proteolytic subunit precursor [Candidatus Hodgkinia cicadicola]
MFNLNNKTIWLIGSLEYTLIHVLCIMVLNNIEIKKEVRVYINSVGGNLFNGLIVYDMIQISKIDVKTICLEYASSVSSLLIISGTIGKRLCLDRSSLYLHQPNITITGNLTILTKGLKNMNWIDDDITKIYMKHCSKIHSNIIKVMVESIWISSSLAINWTVVDNVI